MTDPSEYIDDPALLLRLASAGLSDVQIDSPQYLEKRYMNEIPTPAVLNRIVLMRNYIAEHEGEGYSLKDIADEIGTQQSRLSDILRDYPILFKKFNGGYVVSSEIPEEWMYQYNKDNDPDAPRIQRAQSDPKIKEILDLVKKIYNNSQIEKLPPPSKLPAFLDRAIIDKAYERNPGYCEWAPIAQLRFDQKLLVFIRLLHELEDNADEVMQIISNAWKK